MIRKVVYFSMKVPNRPGIGMQMLKSIAMSKHNLLAFTGFPQGGKAQVDFVPADPVEFARGSEKARRKSGQAENGVSGSGRGPGRRASPRPRQAGQGENQHGGDGRGDRGQPPLRRDLLGEAEGHRADVATARREIVGTRAAPRKCLSASGCWSARPTAARRDPRRATRR